MEADPQTGPPLATNRFTAAAVESRSSHRSDLPSSPQATTAGYSVSFRQGKPDDDGAQQAKSGHGSSRLEQPLSSSSNSQITNSDETDVVFTPPASQSALSGGSGHDQSSSQESQLLQLSQLAAAREKMVGVQVPTSPVGAVSRKRMADGVVKHTRDRSSASPVRSAGHSRNTSTVSLASTSGSRVGELSADLKARLSYAMIKVNHGWQSHSIDQVENLASYAASPSSSNSTVHGHHASSASPQLNAGAAHRGSNNTTPASAVHSHFEGSWGDRGQVATSPSVASPLPTSRTIPSLAPPISLQPTRQSHPRRNSNATYSTSQHPHSLHGSPQTPAQPASQQGTPHARHMRTPVVDPILYSPHQNVRERDAVETLLFMSSPGNSASLKHSFPVSSSQPLPSLRNGGSVTSTPHRTALPSSQPRKSLPTSRPTHHSQPAKRVGFEKSPSNMSEMDVDEPFGTPHTTTSAYSRGTPRRKVNGNHAANDAAGPRQKVNLSMPSGLSGPSKPRPTLREEDIEKMVDMAAAADSSDSDDEIQIPVRRAGAAGSVGI